MGTLYDIDPGPQCPEVVRMIVEIPKNCGNKYEYDAALGVFRLDRPLYSPMHYPGDYGFVPGTLAEDGDPLDVLTMVEDPSFTGCLIEVRPIGVLNMVDQGQPDQKILAIPVRSPMYQGVATIHQLPPHARREIEHFFSIYKELESKRTEMRGWEEAQEAREVVRASRDRYLGARRK